MTPDEIRTSILASLRSVAPESDLSTLAGAADIRDSLDIDSMDFLRFVVRLHETLDVDVPERDYGRIRTVDGCVAYVLAQTRRIH